MIVWILTSFAQISDQGANLEVNYKICVLNIVYQSFSTLRCSGPLTTSLVLPSPLSTY
jgi:hypothetical protein